ncbi:MAG: hypothetical protein WED05_05300 [Candidatus Atabeyarchaeum deiterrae]
MRRVERVKRYVLIAIVIAMFTLLPVSSIAVNGSIGHLDKVQKPVSGASFSKNAVAAELKGIKVEGLCLEIPLFGYRISLIDR